MRPTCIAALAVLPCVAPSLALAQANPDSPENIVVTATRTPSQVANLPAGVTVIDRKTIEERGYVSLTDALAAVPGLRVVQLGGPGSQSSVFIRGTNSNHVLVLRDGVPINDPSDPGGAFNFGVDTLEDVERIEVVRGPLSSLYGSGAIGGVINLITRHGAGAPHGHLTLAGGNPDQLLAKGDVHGGFGIYDYAASVEGYSTRGFDQTPQRERTIHAGEADGDRSKQAEIDLGATPFKDTRFSVLVRARDAKYGYDEPDFDAGNATGYDASLFGRLGVTSKLLDGAWDTSLYLTGTQRDREYTVAFRPADPNQAQSDDRYHGRRGDAQWNNTIRLPDHAFLTASSVSFGYEHVSDRIDTKNNDLAFGSPDFVGRRQGPCRLGRRLRGPANHCLPAPGRHRPAARRRDKHRRRRVHLAAGRRVRPARTALPHQGVVRHQLPRSGAERPLRPRQLRLRLRLRRQPEPCAPNAATATRPALPPTCRPRASAPPASPSNTSTTAFAT